MCGFSRITEFVFSIFFFCCNLYIEFCWETSLLLILLQPEDLNIMASFYFFQSTSLNFNLTQEIRLWRFKFLYYWVFIVKHYWDSITTYIFFYVLHGNLKWKVKVNYKFSWALKMLKTMQIKISLFSLLNWNNFFFGNIWWRHH